MLGAGIREAGRTERKGAGIQSACAPPSGDLWDWVCRYLSPGACAAALTNSRTLPFLTLLLSLQCVSNPSTSRKLHLTPITQLTKLLYLGLSSVFFFDNYNF